MLEDRYFLMDVDSVTEYAREKLDFFHESRNLSAAEIGDGNLNYVYRVRDEDTGKSVIVKQAGPQLRISAEMEVSTDRNRIESELLVLQGRSVPGLVPVIYQYDTVMCACVMEDLSDFQLMRHGLMQHKTYPRFVDDITTYLVSALFATTDIAMEPEKKKEMVKRFINPELCKITEDLVFTEPYTDLNHRNRITPGNEAFVEQELYHDRQLRLEAGKLKLDFMDHAQALIHGDLHTGSIFVTERETKVFDPEFAFFGPIGYDVGNIIANLLFAWANGKAQGEEDFCRWIMEEIEELLQLFVKKGCDYIRRNTWDEMLKPEGFPEYYLGRILADSAAYAGTELIRRIVGMAQVADITSIKDHALRIRLEQSLIRVAKGLILRREECTACDRFMQLLHPESGRAGL